MKNLIWFCVGLLVGDFWRGALMHIFYWCVIFALVWTGHHPFHFA